MTSTSDRAGEAKWELIFSRRIVLINWFAWAGLVSWCWIVAMGHELVPAAWPFLSLVGVLVCGLAFLLVRFLISLVRAKERRSSLCYLCLGTFPVWLVVIHFGYVYLMAAQRRIDSGPLSLLLLPIVSVMAEFEANLRYSHRTEGDRVIMYHQGLPAPEEMVKAADNYLAKLDALLNAKQRVKVRWVRGSLLGRSHVTAGAYSLSDPEPGELLHHVDRHELAHFAINQHLTWGCRMSTLLVEGWAEACATAPDSSRLDEVALENSRSAPSIAELTGPEWASIDAGPVYTQGGAFVAQIVEDFGGGKFFDLYLHGKPETFDFDCQRILGISLSEVERRYTQRIARGTEGARARRLLSKLKLADDVNRSQWDEFCERYATAVDEMRIPQDINVIYETTIVTRQNGERTTLKSAGRVFRRGDERLFACEDNVILLTRLDAVSLRRKRPEDAWQVQPAKAPTVPVHRYLLASSWSSIWTGDADRAFAQHLTSGWDRDPPEVLSLTERTDESGRLVTLRLSQKSDSLIADTANWELTFAERAHWLLVERIEFTDREKQGRTGTAFDYEFTDRVLDEVRSQFERISDGRTIDTSTHRMLIRKPDPGPQVELTLQHYGIDRKQIPTPAYILWPVTSAVAIALLQLLLGVVLCLRIRGTRH